jgi:hypothetical protein
MWYAIPPFEDDDAHQFSVRPAIASSGYWHSACTSYGQVGRLRYFITSYADTLSPLGRMLFILARQRGAAACFQTQMIKNAHHNVQLCVMGIHKVSTLCSTCFIRQRTTISSRTLRSASSSRMSTASRSSRNRRHPNLYKYGQGIFPSC